MASGIPGNSHSGIREFPGMPSGITGMAPRETGNGLGKMGIHPGTPGIAAEITGIPSGTLGMVSGISGIPPGKREFPQESGNCLRRTRIPPKTVGFPPQQIPWNGQFPVFGDTRTPKTRKNPPKLGSGRDFLGCP